MQDNESNHSVISSSNFMNTVIPIGTTNITKAKGRIITQNKLNTKIGPAILVSGNVSCASGNNFQSDIQDTSIQDNLSKNALLLEYSYYLLEF